MSENDAFDGINFEFAGGTPLRDALRAQERKAQALEAEVNQLRSDARYRTVESVLGHLGYTPETARLYPTDGEPTADAVQAWVNANEAVLVKKEDTPKDGTSELKDLLGVLGEEDQDFAEALEKVRSTRRVSTDALAEIGEVQMTGNDPLAAQRQILAILKKHGM